MSDKYMPYNMKKPSKESEDARVAAVFARIGTENNIKTSQNDDADYSYNAPPKVYRAEKRSPLKAIIPIAAAAAAIAVAVPVGANYFANRGVSAGELIDKPSVVQSAVNSSAAESSADNVDGNWQPIIGDGDPLYSSEEGKIYFYGKSQSKFVAEFELTEEWEKTVREAIDSVEDWQDNSLCGRLIFNENARAVLNDRVNDGGYFFDFRTNIICYHECEGNYENRIDLYGTASAEKMQAIIDMLPADSGIEINYYVPSLAELSALSDEKATALVKGIPAESLTEEWGLPAETENNAYFWNFRVKDFVVNLDGNNKAESVRISDNIVSMELEPGSGGPSDISEGLQKYENEITKYEGLLPSDYTDIRAEAIYGVMTDMENLTVSHMRFIDSDGKPGIYKDPESGCFIAEVNYLNVRDAKITFKDGSPASAIDLRPGTAVIIDYDMIDRSYPGCIHCTAINILKYPPCNS